MVIHAYSLGYFPMPSGVDQEIAWYKPNPRAILPLEQFHSSKSFKKFLRQCNFTATINQDFKAVISGCADRKETWINQEIKDCYIRLFELGYAHSIEVWSESELIGGLYGIGLEKAFFAESMFSKRSNASKFALKFLVEHLKRHNFALLEVQFMNPHLKTLGAVEISDEKYMEKLQIALDATRNTNC